MFRKYVLNGRENIANFRNGNLGVQCIPTPGQTPRLIDVITTPRASPGPMIPGVRRTPGHLCGGDTQGRNDPPPCPGHRTSHSHQPGTALTVGSQSALSPPRDEDPNGAAPPLLVCERLEPIQFQRGTAHREKLGRAGKIATSLVGQRVSSVVRLLLAAHSQVGGASGQAETSGARRIR